MRSLPERYPRIHIDKITAKGGAGLAFTIGVMAMFLIALPQIRAFCLLLVRAGILVSAGLYLLHRR